MTMTSKCFLIPDPLLTIVHVNLAAHSRRPIDGFDEPHSFQAFFTGWGHGHAVQNAVDKLPQNLPVTMPLEEAWLRDRRNPVDLAIKAKCSRLGVVFGVDFRAALVAQQGHAELVAMPGIGGPRSVELQGQIAVEANERRREVLDVVWLSDGCFEASSLPLAASLWGPTRHRSPR